MLPDGALSGGKSQVWAGSGLGILFLARTATDAGAFFAVFGANALGVWSFEGRDETTVSSIRSRVFVIAIIIHRHFLLFS